MTATSDCGFPPLGRLSAGRPLVCLPSILGDFAALGPLARRLDDTVTTVGLDLTPLPDAERESIPARAARAARALRARWDDGPFTLIGHSYGGLLAYEVAHQLECSGGRIDLLAIVDIQADARTSLGEGIPEQARCLATVAELIARSIGRPMRLPPEAETATQIADRLAAFGIPLEPSGLDTLAARYRENRWALARYHPTPSHDLPILLLRAASRHPDDDFLPDVGRSAVDPNWGWQNLTSVKVTPVLLPGDHLTMLAEPHVGVLAGNLALHLTPRSVQAAHTESGVEQAAIGRS